VTFGEMWHNSDKNIWARPGFEPGTSRTYGIHNST
jgi:hypothetical protein